MLRILLVALLLLTSICCQFQTFILNHVNREDWKQVNVFLFQFLPAISNVFSAFSYPGL